jgi:periplasmic protein TonB
MRKVKPDYPAVALAAQLEGDVLLQAVVGPDGKVRDVKVLRSVHPLVDEAAKKAVLQYEYIPGQRNGVPESVPIRLTVSFILR